MSIRELKPCPSSPNCVCSQTDAGAKCIVPPIEFKSDSELSLQVVKEAALSIPRTTLVEDRENYLHFECRSRVLGFVDDLEFLMDAEKSVCHVRSASRVGYWDFGANRRRVEKIRKLLAEQSD